MSNTEKPTDDPGSTFEIKSRPVHITRSIGDPVVYTDPEFVPVPFDFDGQIGVELDDEQNPIAIKGLDISAPIMPEQLGSSE